jgi:hypothetical protein
MSMTTPSATRRAGNRGAAVATAVLVALFAAFAAASAA